MAAPVAAGKENTVNVSLKYHASVYRDLDADTDARNRAARAELTCSECGSEDGMQSRWDREMLLLIGDGLQEILLEATTLFYCDGDDHELYQPCWQCNPGDTIPDGYDALMPEQVAAWLGRRCECEDCVRERRG